MSSQNTVAGAGVNEAAPSPLVPADTDLRSLPYMPLDVQRLRDADLTIEAEGDEWRCAVLLWCAAWHQVPAASLPDDDRILAAMAGFGRDLRAWRRVRKMALRGFVLCSDGRLYHPVIAEKAIDARESQAEYRERVTASQERVRKYRNEHSGLRDALAAAGVDAPWNASITRLREMASEHGIDATAAVTGSKPVTVTGPLQDGVTGGVSVATSNAPVTCYKCKGKCNCNLSSSAARAPAGAGGQAHARARICALLEQHGVVYRDRADSRDPIVIAGWSHYSDDDVRAAIQRAQATRAEEGDESPISVRFIDAILRRLSNADGSKRRAGSIGRADQVGDEFLRQYGASAGA